MTKPELDATPEFDCLMVCLLLTLSWDERLLKKLFRKFGLQQENPRFDPAFALYRLHHEFHDPDSPIAANLLRRFSREFRRETARIRGLPDDDNATAPLAITTTLMNESPAGTLWALAGDGRLNLRSLATYHAHRLLLEAFHPATGAFFCASRLREQCAAQEQMLREQRTTLAEQNQRITTLEQENRQLQQALTEAETRRRELRMLRYELERLGRRSPVPESGLPSPVTSTTLVEKDPACPFQREACRHREEAGNCTLENVKVALVGGLDRLERQYRSAFASLGAEQVFFHPGHCESGGVQQLRAAAEAADVVVFITRVNSHNALNVIKGICRRSGKSFLAVRETGPARICRIVAEELNRKPAAAAPATGSNKLETMR